MSRERWDSERVGYTACRGGRCDLARFWKDSKKHGQRVYGVEIILLQAFTRACRRSISGILSSPWRRLLDLNTSRYPTRPQGHEATAPRLRRC